MIPMVNFSLRRTNLFKRYIAFICNNEFNKSFFRCLQPLNFYRRASLWIMMLSIGGNDTVSRMGFLVSLQILLEKF